MADRRRRPSVGRVPSQRSAATSHPTLVALVALVSVLGLTALRVRAPSPPSVPAASAAAIAPVALPISADPVTGRVRGTMLLVHGGGWVGHSAPGQRLLMTTPGRLLLERGWRVVSIDYQEGAPGLQDVLNAAGAELARRTGEGPLCIYGESAGAQLAFVAASRLQAIDCVIGLGTPTDLALYESRGSVSDDFRVRLVAGQITRFFGTTTSEIAPWDPVALAPRIRADVLLVHESDDALVPLIYTAEFQAVRPTTQTLTLEHGDPADTSAFVHGTISQAGRAHYTSAIGTFTDRAVAWAATRHRAVRTGCHGVSRSIAQFHHAIVRAALRCLARRDGTVHKSDGAGFASIARRVRGRITASRVWVLLRSTSRGRRALAAIAHDRATLSVRSGDPSKLSIRLTQ
jgi:acetyl esterase/lipase